MMKAAKDSLKKLGLSEHQAAVSCHTDEPQPHIHVIVNTVHPLTGLVAKLKYTKRKFSDFARIFQREEGTMYCPKREENYQKRQRGQKTNYVNPVFMEAWKSSPNGRTFFDRLKAKGYYPAQGRGRIVVVDERGKPINPKRHLPDVDNKTYKERLADIALKKLPTVEELDKAMRKAGAKHNKRLHRHDQRHNEAIGELEGRQSQERDQTREEIRTAMETKRSDLQDKYRVHDFKRVIRKLDREIKGTGFWGRLLRTDKRKQAKLDKLQTALDKREKHIEKQIEKIEHRGKKQLQAQEKGHQSERTQLSSLLEKWKPAVQDRQQTYSSAQEHIYDRTLDLPGMER